MIQAHPVVFLGYIADVLYCVSEMSVCVILPILVDGNPAFRRDILDNLGVPRSSLCCILQPSAQLVVARPQALYFFHCEGRGPCLAFPTEGPKASISSCGNYLIHSTAPSSITIYDVINRLIAFRGKGLVSSSFDTTTDGLHTAMLCIAEGTILKLTEISLDQRINLLLKRGLYVPAVALARSEIDADGPQSKAVLLKALCQYSEHLMSRGRYDDAAEQLVETISDDLEPSWVITRLVEQPGLRSGLRFYLEALHAAGKAAFVHTKVLITCYRHDRARGTILGSKATEKTTDEYVINVFSDVDWSEEQVDAAISLCREAGLFEVAERVSRRRCRYVQLACTLVEDLNQPEKALELLYSLSDDEAGHVIEACGRHLLVGDPSRFVKYLAQAICHSTTAMPIGRLGPTLRLESFLPLFVDMPAWRAVLLENIVKTPGGLPTAEVPKVWLLLFESLVCVDVVDHLHSDSHTKVLHSVPASDEVDAEVPVRGRVNQTVRNDKVRTIGRRALKVLQSRRSVIDLRAALEIAELYGHDPCLEYLYEHLQKYHELGICLRTSENGPSLLRACRRHGERDPHLWIECLRYFTPIAAKEEYGTTESSAEEEISGRKSSKSLNMENKGIDDTSFSKIIADGESDKMSALDIMEEAIIALDRNGMLSSLELIDVVTRACPNGAWGLIREYFERCASALQRDATISEHNSLLLETELKELRKEAKRLGEETVVIKPKTCASCEDAISIPAVHFFCEHSFHASCLAPGGVVMGGMGTRSGSASSLISGYSTAVSFAEERTGMWGEECPRCAPELDAMVSMRQALQEKNNRHDDFFASLEGSRDGFSQIIEYLERSPFI